jgi:hypothetical protein
MVLLFLPRRITCSYSLSADESAAIPAAASQENAEAAAEASMGTVKFYDPTSSELLTTVPVANDTYVDVS